ncbi:response regulator transcription factor [Nitrospira sp. NS4]|uniref:response regulator transcription factor n=1 Tax=Nitrospira sp. NS4 TaxID=3414498 RepID=UPI003C2B809D
MSTPITTMSTVCESILIFMKEDSLAQSLKKTFESNGYRSIAVTAEPAAYAEAKAAVPALILIDRRHSTPAALRQFRAIKHVPIIAVDGSTRSCSDEECIDDYNNDIDLVVCSQNPRELLARVRAILRRRDLPKESTTHYGAGNLRMDLDRHEVTIDGRHVELTPKEFQILRQFLEAPSRVFSRQDMLNRVWGEGYALEEHALDVHIHSLRQKIEADPTHPRLIVTVRGVGYKLRA